MSKLNKVVFYDGDCGFCNRSVAFVLKNDSKKDILFAPLQSDYCKRIFDEHGWAAPDLSTFYYLRDGTLYRKSTAAFEVMRNFSYPQKLMMAAYIVPRFIRDGVYDFIAKRRQRISKGYCVIPSEEDRKRFL